MTTEFTAENVARGFGFLEGLRWHDGALWASDFFRHTVFRIDPDNGNVDSVCEVPEQPSGLVITSEGSLYIVSMLDRRVLKASDCCLEVIADLSDLSPHPLNDMTTDSLGRLYVGGFGGTAQPNRKLLPAPIFRIDPDGEVTVVSHALTYPNGMVFNADETKLYVADTFASRVAVFNAFPGGGLCLESVFKLGEPHETTSGAWASGDFLPDGMARGTDDTLWIADANGSGIAQLHAATNAVTRHPVAGSDGRVYALAISPDGDLFGCVAPRFGTWDTGADFPSRLIRLCRSESTQAQTRANSLSEGNT